MSYQVKIEIFEGPLDLLLHLIQKSDLDIYDIPISNITSEYLNYLEVLSELNLNIAGDFLVMATTLMQIKAKTLLPVDPTSDEAEGPDPRAELVQRLLEYQKFKEAAKHFDSKIETQKNQYYRGAPMFNSEDRELDISLQKLLDAFSSVLETAKSEVREIMVEEIPVEVRIREILDRLASESFLKFSELFPKGSSRIQLVVSFLALLELVKLHQVQVTQPENFSEILIQKTQEPEVAEPALSE